MSGSRPGTLIAHYLETALDRSGVRIDSDVRAELREIAETLDHLDHLAARMDPAFFTRVEARLNTLATLIDDSTAQLYTVIGKLERDR